MKFHFCLSLMIRSSQVVHSPSQLRSSCSTNSCFNCRVSGSPRCIFNEVCVTEGVVGSPLCLIILVRQVLPQSLYPSVWLLGSRPLASRLICLVDFRHTSICESFCLDRSGCRHQRLGVGTVQSIVSTQLPSSTLAVSAHPHIHGVAGRVET